VDFLIDFRIAILVFKRRVKRYASRCFDVALVFWNEVEAVSRFQEVVVKRKVNKILAGEKG